jgi:hypothetical protein
MQQEGKPMVTSAESAPSKEARPRKARTRAATPAPQPEVSEENFRTASGIESWLRSRGANFRRQTLELASIDRDQSRRNQARVSQGAVDDNIVLQYAEAMNSGDEFPPIVVYETHGRFVIIDGNHRLAGLDLNDATSFQAYVVQDPTEYQVRVLTYEANTTNGLPTPEADRIRQAINLIETDGMPATSAAELLRIPKGKLKAAVDRYRADERFTALGIRRLDKLSLSARIRLMRIQSDPVLKAAAELALDAALTSEDIQDLVNRINAARSEKEQLAIIRHDRDLRQTAIATTVGGKSAVPQRLITLQRALSMVTGTDTKALRADFDRLPREVRFNYQRDVNKTMETLLSILRDLQTMSRKG